MSLTREHIDKLVARFSGHKEPPTFYISEYEELTSKLHDFSVREQQLKEKLRLQSIDASPCDEDPPLYPTNQQHFTSNMVNNRNCPQFDNQVSQMAVFFMSKRDSDVTFNIYAPRWRHMDIFPA